MTLKDFITANRITMTATKIDQNPNAPDWTEADHWRVNMRRVPGGKVDTRMSTYFSQGYAHHGAEPDAASVLDCLASDAASVDQARDYEDWARDFGYDPDSRKAEKIYKACQRRAERLKAFLGDDLYQALLYEMERL